jgi:DNA-binding CsgD family transcriptional regulator
MNASVVPNIDTTVNLPPKMRDVCRQVALGFPKKIVAMIFGLSIRTVEQDVRIAMRKTRAKNSVELSVYFMCKELGAKLIIQDGKRAIITLSLLAIFLFYEFTPFNYSVRVLRSKRIETSRLVRRSESEIDYMEL